MFEFWKDEMIEVLAEAHKSKQEHLDVARYFNVPHRLLVSVEDLWCIIELHQPKLLRLRWDLPKTITVESGSGSPIGYVGIQF